jgi:hypothetical protein
VREQGPAAIAATAANRQRAFSLFIRTYEQARRAIAFLRFKEQDVDRIAPSLYGGRANSNHRRRGNEGSESSASAGTGEPTTSIGIAPPAMPAAPVMAAPANGAAVVGAPIPVGFPGNDPYRR